MGRLGISYEEVAKVADELQQKGIKPTVDGVRARLGTGSKSTIVPYLRQWRFAQSNEMQEGESFSVTQLLALVRNLYARLRTIEETKSNDEKKQIFELSQRLEKEENLRQQLEKEILVLKTQLLLSEKEKTYLLTEKVNLKKELKALSNVLI